MTKRLEPAKRQFFVWFYLEKRKIKWIKQEMDRLSLALRDITGNNFEAASVLRFHRYEVLDNH